MADETSDEKPADAPSMHATRSSGGYAVDPRYSQRNLAERLFPGPSRSMSDRANKRIQGLLQPLDDETLAKVRRDRQNRRATDSDNSRRAQLSPKGGNAPGILPANGSTSEDISQLRDTVEEQNELLRAILASSVDTQTDARATAQNSRTFAWAGTAIALLTLIATVIAIAAAIRG
ncbi:MAG TPA: hypothetical protein VHX87_02845 [Galbitalea sp.]|nr:hypothetical protein [Galbitalea sp.]